MASSSPERNKESIDGSQPEMARLAAPVWAGAFSDQIMTTRKAFEDWWERRGPEAVNMAWTEDACWSAWQAACASAIDASAEACDSVVAQSKNALFRSGAKICAGQIRSSATAVPCAGLNCGTTTGDHSPECRAEHAAAVAGGRFVKGDAGARDDVFRTLVLQLVDMKPQYEENIVAGVSLLRNAFAALSARAPEAAAGEPVAWRWEVEVLGQKTWQYASHWSTGPKDAQPLYTAPCAASGQKLTDEQVDAVPCELCNGAGQIGSPGQRCFSCDGSGKSKHQGLYALPDFKNALTPYGMLVRALRIVANTTLYDMGQALSLKPSTLSAMEFGRAPVTLEIVCETAAFFENLGVNETLPALHAALRSDSATASDKEGA